MTSLSVARRVSSLTSVLAPAMALLLATGCSTGSTGQGTGGSGNGGSTGSGGATGNGGTTTSSSTTTLGGTTSSGGSTGNGGTTGSGGTSAVGSGGTTVKGGTSGSGGVRASGGVTGLGGTTANGGSTGSGGATPTGGSPGTGGTAGVGGSTGVGGAALTGGITGTGGATGMGGTTATTTPSTCDPTLPAGTSYIASASGSGSTCTVASPCSANTAIGKLKAGQTAYLRGGTYSGLQISNSGDTTGSITIAAYPCELPIVNAGGVGISGTYVSIQGIVSRNTASGFGNKWTGGGTTNSNGHIEFINCIADMNTANGIAFRSAVGVHIKQSIVAHNGNSTTASWSSGVDLFGAQGTYQDNIVEQTVAFENVDMQEHTDGSGFIVDDIGTGATFVNNIGFRNGGSCIRLTTSTNTHIINNSCYGDGLDPAATGPSTPDEIFFSSSQTTSGAVLYNNLAVATGTGGDTQAIFGANGATSANNVTNNKNTITDWVDAAGTNPDFHLSATAMDAIGKGTTTEAPAMDIGFDPKCITKTPPTGTGVQSWWIYSIDYTYITNIGGVAQCFHPKARTGTPDIGAYAH
jgi:hypothetical protein